MRTLFLLLGYPGAGKTTTAKIISQLTGAEYLSSDVLRKQLFPQSNFNQAEHDELYAILDSQLVESMKQGKDVVYDANLNRLVHRQEKYDLAAKYKYKTVLVWVKTPRQIARQRRIEEFEHHHLVPPHETPAEMFERTASAFEEPLENEPHIEIDGTKVTQDYVKENLAQASIELSNGKA